MDTHFRRRVMLKKPSILPRAYRQVLYISSGSSQYIDTGILANSGVKIRVKFSFNTVPGDGSVVAARSGNTRMYAPHQYNGLNLGYVNYYAGYSPKANELLDVVTELYAGKQTMNVNGVEKISRTDATEIKLNTSFYIFGCHYNGFQYPSSMKLYACEIWDSNGENLVRQFYPAIRKSDGVSGLFDMVSKSFFVSPNGANFTPGPVV